MKKYKQNFHFDGLTIWLAKNKLIAYDLLSIFHLKSQMEFLKCLIFSQRTHFENVYAFFVMIISLNKKTTILKKHRDWALAHVYYESPLAVYSHTIFSSCIFLSLWNLVRSIRMYLHFYLLNAAVKRSNDNLWRWIYCLNGPFFGIKWRNSFNRRKI